MKALVWTAPNKAEVRDVPVPEAAPGQARLKVTYCGICGSDIGIFSGKHPRAKAPLILGHEFIGVIDEINGDAGEFKVGDRVAGWPNIPCKECYFCKIGIPHVCKSLKITGIDLDGGIAEYVVCDVENLVKLEDTLSDKAASIIEPLAVAVRSLHQADFKTLSTAAIMGAGPIGIMVGVMLKYAGASRIIISDIDQGRLDLCKEFGFETVNAKETTLTEYVDSTTNGVGTDYVFECTGSEPASLEMSKVCRIGGMICQTGVHKMPHQVDLRDINFKEQQIIGSRGHTMDEFRQAAAFAPSIQEALEKAVTQIIPLAESDKVFDYIADPDMVTVKIAVDCLS